LLTEELNKQKSIMKIEIERSSYHGWRVEGKHHKYYKIVMHMSKGHWQVLMFLRGWV
jgi:hypothetical protein